MFNNIFSKSEQKYKDLDVNEFKSHISVPDNIVIDVRTPGEIQEGKINGALEMDINSPSFLSMMNSLDKNKHYYIYCRSGQRSGSACSIMADHGFENLNNLKGGFIAWNKDI